MTKDEYILRMISKISKKKWEYFVVTRIFHRLNDLEIEFVTQQLVRRPDGSRALTDLYFPQFGIHLEIDEGQHLADTHAEADRRRDQDIVSVTDHQIWRLPIESIQSVASAADKIVTKIQELKEKAKEDRAFTPWNFEGRYDPNTYRGLEKITVDQNVLFRKQADALKLFGYDGGNYQRGIWRLNDNSGNFVWFPRLYEQPKWNNELSPDGTKIIERSIGENTFYPSHYEENVERITFARAKDVLGGVLYRYVGNFRLNPEMSESGKTIFDRTSKEVKISLA